MYLGSKEVKNFKLGDKQVKSIYLGDKQIWSDFVYDYVDDNEYNEIDFLYTTDLHGIWLEGNYRYTREGWPSPSYAYLVSSTYKSIEAYKNNLESQGIKTLLIDGGDFTHCSGTNSQGNEPQINLDYGLTAVNRMNSAGYFAATVGNHEYREGVNQDYGSRAVDNILKKFTGNSEECSIVACNLFGPDGELVFKPYKTAKIGSKKIAVIGVAAAGFDSTTIASLWSGYSLVDGADLYNLVQGYLDLFISHNFDQVILLDHLGLNGDGGRWVAGTNSVVQNTSGITIATVAHDHEARTSAIITDKDGNSVHRAAQPRCAFLYLTRIRIPSTGTVSSEYLQTY